MEFPQKYCLEYSNRANQATRIFEPFITTQRGKGGSGLGANIIYNLVNKVLLGKISCENLTAPTHGAKFTIIIPNLKDNKEESHDA